MKYISKCLFISLMLSMAGMVELLKAETCVTDLQQHHNERAAEAADLFIRFLKGVKMKWNSFTAELLDLLSGNPAFINICKYLYRAKEVKADKKQVDNIVNILQEMLNDPLVQAEMDKSPEMKKILDELEKQKRSSQYWALNKFNETKWKLSLYKLIAQSVKCK